MSKNDLIIGLDIGTYSTKIVVGQKRDPEEDPFIIGVGQTKTEGIRKGIIFDLEEATSSISSVKEEAERMCGSSLDNALIAFGGLNTIIDRSKGVVAVSKADSEITENDIKRVIEAATAVAVPPNYEILHVIPQVFTVDSQKGIKDPLGMSGIRLEVEALVIFGATSVIKNLSKCLFRTGMDINDFVLNILATSFGVLEKKQKEVGVLIINIGASTTEIAVFEEGELLMVSSLPIGSAHITNDIAIGLRVSIDIAEKIKLKYAQVLSPETKSRGEIDLSEFDPEQKERFSKKQINDIIEARCEEIFKMIDKELRKIDRSGKLPAGAIITGGGANLPGIIEFAKKELKLPAQIGYPKDLPKATERINDPAFSTSIGLVLWACENLFQKSRIPGAGLIKKFFSKTRNFLGR